MFSFTSFPVVLFLLTVSANTYAETVRGAHRELEAQVDLGTASDYVILAKTGISTVPTSAITGDIAVSPKTAAAITGFSLSLDNTGNFSTSEQLTGKAYAATPTLLTAVSNMEAAYTDAEGRSNTVAARIDILGGLLAGLTLTPGVYTFGTDVLVKGGDVTFDGGGVFIIQMTGNLVQAASTKVTLSNGALAENIFWQIEGTVTVGAGAHMEGIILAKTAVTFITGSTLNGRIFSQTACALQMATITQPSF
jgi:hypothetical protein